MTFLWTDTWSDRIGCWADVYDIGYDIYRTCEAHPDPASHLGLCARHEAELKGFKDGRRVTQAEVGRGSNQAWSPGSGMRSIE